MKKAILALLAPLVIQGCVEKATGRRRDFEEEYRQKQKIEAYLDSKDYHASVHIPGVKFRRIGTEGDIMVIVRSLDTNEDGFPDVAKTLLLDSGDVKAEYIHKFAGPEQELEEIANTSSEKEVRNYDDHGNLIKKTRTDLEGNTHVETLEWEDGEQRDVPCLENTIFMGKKRAYEQVHCLGNKRFFVDGMERVHVWEPDSGRRISRYTHDGNNDGKPEIEIRWVFDEKGDLKDIQYKENNEELCDPEKVPLCWKGRNHYTECN